MENYIIHTVNNTKQIIRKSDMKLIFTYNIFTDDYINDQSLYFFKKNIMRTITLLRLIVNELQVLKLGVNDPTDNSDASIRSRHHLQK